MGISEESKKKSDKNLTEKSSKISTKSNKSKPKKKSKNGSTLKFDKKSVTKNKKKNKKPTGSHGSSKTINFINKYKIKISLKMSRKLYSLEDLEESTFGDVNDWSDGGILSSIDSGF